MNAVLGFLAVFLIVARTSHAPAQSVKVDMAQRINEFRADRESLDRKYPIAFSEKRADRLDQFLKTSLKDLKSIDFDRLDEEGQTDYVLLRNHIEHERSDISIGRQRQAEMQPIIPFAAQIVELDEERRQFNQIDPRSSAERLDAIKKNVQEAKSKNENASYPKAVANRALNALKGLEDSFEHWFSYYRGYDPLFTWWCEKPFSEALESLKSYTGFVREKLVGMKADDTTTIIGDPIGRDALIKELEFAMIPYTPEELVNIANKEFEWCDKEMLRASKELGYGRDWHKALEHVKQQFVEPGQQPKLIHDLAIEAIDFLDRRDLVTVPELCKETWRMEMMSPERQLVSPFFLGGEVIQVSYPTETMSHEAKMMSMRGNNRYFARATVQHELIPGHHLQGFMLDRYRPYRELFNTPFWVEGWALYWEMRLWDLGFAKTPEERIGMLFWRMHRCARIIFSLSFHLGKMTPQECIDFLVERVGFERENAAAEVRRSFGGSYEPLYQAAYMLGGLQFRSLWKELVESKQMTERQFHDSILQGGAIPVELVRARLRGQKLSVGFRSSWRFAD